MVGHGVDQNVVENAGMAEANNTYIQRGCFVLRQSCNVFYSVLSLYPPQNPIVTTRGLML